MLSDWHVGSGAGRPGNIDRLIVRDADGLPFVPAKTLRGIWRDACERLARGLDGGETGDWSRFVDLLFGSQPALSHNDPTGRHADPNKKPIESALRVSPALLPEALRDRVKGNQEFLEAMTFVKPGVRIDRRSGRAVEKQLRFEEMARVDAVLVAECALRLHSAELREAASALLVGGAKLVERLGGKRRRGAGRCKLEIDSTDPGWAVAWLEANEKAPAWTEPNDDEAAASEAAPSSGSWVVVPLVLNLTGPLAVSYRTVGNVVETLDFLPGSYLLPHVTRVLTNLGVDPRASIRRGDLCVLPATLEVGGRRGRPVPMALFADKNDRTRMVNRLRERGPVEGQFKQLRAGYVAPGLPLRHRTVPRAVQTHNTVKDDAQRPTSEVGGVYTYEAIAPMEKGRPVRLRSELRLRKSLEEQLKILSPDWRLSLSGSVSLGRSKKDDYGEVAIEVEEAQDLPESGEPGQTLVVWLLSDTLLRDERLRPAPTAEALGAELARRLGIPIKPRESNDGLLDELVRVRRLDTWHVGWGLPRPSLVAIQAGSCIAFTARGEIDRSRLHEIEVGGVGERTAEGYGQVRFDDPLLSAASDQLKLTEEDMTAPHSNKDLPAISQDDRGARLLEREVWKNRIRRGALAIAADRTRRQALLKWGVQNDRPPMSQLGSLRGQVAQLRGAADAQAILAWLDHLAANDRRREKWPNGAIGKVRDLVEKPAGVWLELTAQDWPTLTDGAKERLREELWALAVRTLIDACIRAHKRDLETREGNRGA
jgi:CRISPR-associated protein Csx10